ncbi:cytospin-A-like isoform X3 [Littorina saxatilis]|uniref:cytospin-A-like isoform X3 n=1 Tax=Littorina saxatilis TaxID=31220 RepID=UPI0038B4FC4A
MGGLVSSTDNTDSGACQISSGTMRKQEKGEKEKGGAAAATTTTTATTPAATPKATRTASTTTASTPSATATPKASKPATPASMGMKHSKSDHSGLSGRSGKSATPVNKKYMSKSQENLSTGTGKKKLTVVKEIDPSAATSAATGKASSAAKSNGSGGAKSGPASAAKSTSTSTSTAEKNKENQVLKEKEKNSGFVKPKALKPQPVSAMRKASSTQSIDIGSNTSGSMKSVNSNKSAASQNSIKRAQSTQNVSKDKSLKKRTSAPADVMAYNAELLANFEKEKKILEERISQLTKVAEGRKGEIEKYKYEVKRLKETVAATKTSSMAEELEQLRHQNKHLMDRMKELDISVEQYTDTEKLIMKIGSGSVKSLGKSGDSVSDHPLNPSISCDSLSTDGAKAALPPGLHDNRMHMGKLGSLHRSSSMTTSEPGMSLADLCGTPDHPSILSMEHSNWDKQSNKSCNSDALSEISVACLTERILQMEETNYSTTEELQATLQELGDLQDAVNELTEENGRLVDEKTVLLESLCTQTEKLETTRTQVEQLKSLLISGNLPDKTEREAHLLQLLKSAQEEREELFRKQTEWSNALRNMEADCREQQDMTDALRDKIQVRSQAGRDQGQLYVMTQSQYSCPNPVSPLWQVLEDKLQVTRAEGDANERLAANLREEVSANEIELARFKTLLDSEKSKVAELEKCQQAENQSELETLLDQTRQDKARCEQRLANLQESLAHSQNEAIRLRDSLATRDEELKVARNNAKTEVSELQYRMEKSDKDRTDALQELETLREHIDQLQQDCDRYLEEKKTYCARVQEINGDLHALRMQKSKTEHELTETLTRHQSEAEEWQQFQKDLQVAVVIANEFRAETAEGMQKVSEENMSLRERCLNQQLELDRVKAELQVMKSAKAFEESRSPGSRTVFSTAELKGKVAGCVDRELVTLREGGGRRGEQRTASQSLSVKALIKTIEEQRKSGCSSMQSSQTGSRRNSTDTECSYTSYQDMLKSPTSPPTPSSPASPTKDFRNALNSMDKSPGEKMTLQPRLSGSGLSSVSETPAGKSSQSEAESGSKAGPQISSILKDRGSTRRNSNIISDKDSSGKDPLSYLAKQMGGSKRNALLKWCQQKTMSYNGVDITNFSSSWNDGLAFCALMHGYLPEKIPYNTLNSEDKRRNFTLAFTAAESVGISSSLNLNDMVAMERPDWQAVMTYVTSLYKHFEMDARQAPASSPSPSLS